jgi:hypothetical protein
VNEIAEAKSRPAYSGNQHRQDCARTAFINRAIAVQRLIGATHLFDPSDRVQYRGVMPAAKLAADLL